MQTAVYTWLAAWAGSPIPLGPGGQKMPGNCKESRPTERKPPPQVQGQPRPPRSCFLEGRPCPGGSDPAQELSPGPAEVRETFTSGHGELSSGQRKLTEVRQPARDGAP